MTSSRTDDWDKNNGCSRYTSLLNFKLNCDDDVELACQLDALELLQTYWREQHPHDDLEPTCPECSIIIRFRADLGLEDDQVPIPPKAKE